MRISLIALTTTLLATPALGSLFFKESKADKIKANLESIGYEVADSAGLVKDSVIESFDPESLKHWLEAHGVTDAADQTLEYAKHHKDWLLEDIKDFAATGQDHASSLLNKGKDFYDKQSNALSASVWSKWSDSKLKEFLDARGVEVPQHSARDQLLALVSRTKHKLPINFQGPTGHYWFDGWSRDELVKKLKDVGESIDGSRKELAQRLAASYSKSYASGKEKGGEAADKLAETVGDWKEATAESFNKWSLDDIKEYISDFGGEISGTKDNLVESAKDHYHYFVHGSPRPKTLLEKAQFHVHEHLHNVRSHVHEHLRGVQAHIHSHVHHVYSSARAYVTKLLGLNAYVHNDL